MISCSQLRPRTSHVASTSRTSSQSNGITASPAAASRRASTPERARSFASPRLLLATRLLRWLVRSA
eukprot:scaffold49878_cov40-Tisochrysis_lutea.AAC.2